jgi:hypothetical protein
MVLLDPNKAIPIKIIAATDKKIKQKPEQRILIQSQHVRLTGESTSGIFSPWRSAATRLLLLVSRSVSSINENLFNKFLIYSLGQNKWHIQHFDRPSIPRFCMKWNDTDLKIFSLVG